MGRGVIDAGLFRAERYEIEQRTSDPSTPAANEEWLRVDIKPTYEDADGNTQTGVAEYRSANSDGSVDTAPVAALGHPTDSNVIDKVRAHVDAGGSPTGTGFIPFAWIGATYSKRRLEHPTDGQVSMHDALTASAIPDSAIHRWKYSEGSGTTTADSIGTADGTINGATWVSGTWQGGNALSFDVTDDYVDVGPLGTFGSNLTTDHAIAFTVEDTSHTDFDTFLGVVDGAQELQIDGRDDGRIRWTLIDQDRDALRVKGSTPVDDGTKHRVVCNKTANSASGMTVYVDTAADSMTQVFDGAYDSTADFSVAFTWGSVNNNGSPQDFVGATMDDPIIYSSSLSSSEIQDDYNVQPWT